MVSFHGLSVRAPCPSAPKGSNQSPEPLAYQHSDDG